MSRHHKWLLSTKIQSKHFSKPTDILSLQSFTQMSRFEFIMNRISFETCFFLWIILSKYLAASLHFWLQSALSTYTASRSIACGICTPLICVTSLWPVNWMHALWILLSKRHKIKHNTSSDQINGILYPKTVGWLHFCENIFSCAVAM